MELPRKPSILLAVLPTIGLFVGLCMAMWAGMRVSPAFFDLPYMEDVVTLIAPGAWVALMVLSLRPWNKRQVRYFRWKRGQCLKCGYDLRAHEAGEKCLECGTLISAKSAIIAGDQRSTR